MQVHTLVASSLEQTVCIQQIGMSDAKSAHALLYSFRTGLSSSRGQPQHTDAVSSSDTGRTGSIKPIRTGCATKLTFAHDILHAIYSANKMTLVDGLLAAGSDLARRAAW
jgi:hypothetical protein